MAARFGRSPGAPLWTLEPAPSGCAVAYAPLDDTASPPDSLSVAESWEAFPGTYLVLPAGTPVGQGLADSLASFRAGRPLRFIWVADPGDYGAQWEACWIAADPGAGVTQGLGSVRLRNYALWIGGGCGIGLAAGGEGIAITPRADEPGSVSFSAGFGTATLSGGAAVTLPLGAALAGCALTGLTLENGAAAGAGDFERLDVGLRIFARDQQQPWLPDRLASWRYPVFASPQPASGASLPVALSLHPLLPEAPYTALDLLETSSGPAELASCYVTANGKAVHLVPLAPSGEPELAARFVPALRPLCDVPSATDPFYLVPSGCFRLKVCEGGSELVGAQRLMCGKSGIEYIEIEQPGSEIWFAPGGPALAVGKGLEATARTAYAAVFGSGGAAGGSYRAQAEGAALFAPSQTAFMPFRTLSGKALAAAPGAGRLPGGYPLLPFTGIEADDLGPYEQLEYQAVASTRKALIEALPTPGAAEPAAGPGAEPTTQALTPQGLLADVDGGGHVANLTLALSPAGAVEMTGVSAALTAALQASQLFLVATEPKSLAATPPACGEVRIPSSADGSQLWGIEVWPQSWSASETVLVLKFAGKSLVELMADTATWAGHEGADFNGGAEGVAQAQRTLAAAVERARASEAPEFKPFAELATDPAWEGVLFLNAPVPPAELPPEIAGLAAGLDASAFKAHHIGLTVTPATNSGGTVTAEPSSLFGLIFYENPNSAAGAAPPYSFAVRSLKVRFENSLVKTFASTIELLVDQLFGEPAALVESREGELAPQPPNLLLLEGVYQQQGSHGGYTFTTTEANLFTITSPVLDLVEVSLAQFVTVVAPRATEPTAPAQSRFVLSGSLRFQAPPAGVPDVFSFGPPAGAKEPLSATQLFFSNLWITLDYVPADRSKDRYAFDASKALPDPTRSAPRQGSLGAGFPLTPTGFVQVNPPAAEPAPAQPPTPATPASLGFLGIGTEPPLGSTIKAPWFGLVADLGFGTAGALAAEAGFKASMLFAWSPGDPKVANAGLGLKLPGTGPGGKLLSLQGVLKLKIGQLTLTDSDGTYVLELDRIALGVLMLSLPPSGQIRALLFADPTGKDHTTLGWYAGYAKTGGSG